MAADYAHGNSGRPYKLGRQLPASRRLV